MYKKSRRELEIMHEANRRVLEVLGGVCDMVKPGVTTGELDRFAEAEVKRLGGVPAFKGYPHPLKKELEFPGYLCTSVNNEVVHGIPSDERKLKEGDVLSVDFGINLDGYFGDAAVTVAVGEIDEKTASLLKVTKTALMKGIDTMRPGKRVQDISHTIQEFVEEAGFSVVRDFTGHGIGRRLHEEPQVPNFGQPNRGPRLEVGTVLALEPMVNAGSYRVRTGKDGWTVFTDDGSNSAHFEYSVAVTEDGPWILGLPSKPERVSDA